MTYIIFIQRHVGHFSCFYWLQFVLSGFALHLTEDRNTGRFSGTGIVGNDISAGLLIMLQGDHFCFFHLFQQFAE